MTRLLKRMLAKRAGNDRVHDRRNRAPRLPMILSFDGRIVRLRLPNEGDFARTH